jgi:hypothetical protein
MHRPTLSLYPQGRRVYAVVNRHRRSCPSGSVPRYLLSLRKSGEGIKGFVFARRRLFAPRQRRTGDAGIPGGEDR